MMRRSLLLVIAAVLIGSRAQATPVCVASSVAAMMHTTCTIGQLQFSFNGVTEFGEGESAINPADVTFTLGGTQLSPSFTLSGDFLASSSGPMGAAEYFELNYTASSFGVFNGKYPWVFNKFETAYSPTDIQSQFPVYGSGSNGSGFAEYASCIGPPGFCYAGVGSYDSVYLMDGALVLNGSSPSPNFSPVFVGSSFTGSSLVYVFNSGSITEAYLASGTSTFDVVAKTPEPSTIAFLGCGLLALFLKIRGVMRNHLSNSSK